MANTYSVYAQTVAYATNKVFLALVNGSGSGRVLRVYRIWMNNYQTSAISGGIAEVLLMNCSEVSGGSAATVVKRDSNNESFPAQITATTGSTVTNGAVYRDFVISSDEGAVTAGTIDELFTYPNVCEIWNSGYGETSVQPITIREGEALCLKEANTIAAGVVDVEFEVTLEAS